ncbi:hypothetical protein [Halovivax limisalsi]|uniref:hypothetical protein n=1 Tax=Halovivax limisalsi TaxID=1453760 RepID=UPI001FFD1AAD|nr:hypothetical protein [Halovivax limisalsi]
MIASAPAILFDSFPWWIAVPMLYLTVLIAGMALDETYVNRTTPLSAAIVLSVHSLLNGGLWAPLSLYVDVGLFVGLYGLYAYVVDGYVGEPFRLAAYLLYSPLSVVLVLLFPEILFVVALAVAGYANMHLLAVLHPVEPYYFGPDSPDEVPADGSEWGTRDPVERSDDDPGAGLSSAIAGRSIAATLRGDAASTDESAANAQSPRDGRAGVGETAGAERPSTDPSDPSGASATDSAPTGPADASTTEGTPEDESTPDRGVLPGFMRRV